MTAVVTQTTTWNIDPVHSVADFAVRHMMISTVRGRFGGIEGTIQFDPDNPAAGSVNVTIDASSITTGEERRDSHLQSPDFFDLENHPHITFTSKRIVVNDATHYSVVGNLMIRGVTREVVLDVTFDGQIVDAYGNDRIAFGASTEINRQDFGVSWNAPLEAGGFVVSDRVRITLSIAAIRATE